MTIDEATETITRKLQEVLAKPEVSVQLAKTAGTQPITGQYMIAPDGTINLRAIRTFARGRQVGHRDSPGPAKTHVPVFRLARSIGRRRGVQQQGVLRDYRRRRTGRQRAPRADHWQRNGAGRPGRCERIIAGVEHTTIWIARPAPGGVQNEQILPVDYEAISKGGSAATNYQILPGDRVFIAEDGVSAFSNFLTKITMPVERLFGVTSLGASTVRSTQTLGRSYNKDAKLLIRFLVQKMHFHFQKNRHVFPKGKHAAIRKFEL